MLFLIIIGFIIFFIVLYIILKIVSLSIDFTYHHLHPEKKKLNKKLLRSYFIGKYGRGGKQIYKHVKKKIWENYKIR